MVQRTDYAESNADNIAADEGKSRDQLLHELHLSRLENRHLVEKMESASDPENLTKQTQLILQCIATLDQTIRRSTNLEEMMTSLMDALRSIFQCHQAWLLHPCDPFSPSWKVPFRSVDEAYPIPFPPDMDLPVTQDLIANCRIALRTDQALPLGATNAIKDIPEEAKEVGAKAGMLICLHPKVGRPWLMGIHHCGEDRVWSPEEKQLFKDVSGRIADALSATLFYRNLEENQARLKHLSTQLFRAQEEERKRVAEEIHDELGQATLAIKVGVENALYCLEDAPENIKRPLQSAAHLSSDIVEKMRRMQRALYPPTLRDFGCITALNGFLDDFSNIYSVAVIKQIHITEDQIPEFLRVSVFRIAQEALYNVGKHSQAEEAILLMEISDAHLYLEVTDNGQGFDPASVLRYPDNRLGLGLTSMRERAEMCGGFLDIHSSPGNGTTIHAVWSL